MLFKYVKMMLAAMAVISFMVDHAALAQSWPAWRGAERDGHVRDFTVPEVWPDSLQKIWRVEVGAGLSSPVLQGDRLYVLTRDGDNEVVSAYSTQDGRRIWQQSYAASFVPNPQAIVPRFFPVSSGKGPFATPLLAGDKLYTLGVDRMLSCFEAESGKVLWQQHLLKQQLPDKLVYECAPCGCREDGKEFDQPGACSACGMTLGPKGIETTATQGRGNYYGAAASPIADGQSGFVNIGNPAGSDVLAFDLATGAEKWRWRGPAPSSSSPVIAELHGVRQLVVLTRTNLVGLALDDGRELWHFDISSNAQIVTPIVFESTILFSAYRSPTTSVKISKTPNGWSAVQAWSTNDVTLYTSTPVLISDHVFGLSYANRGQLFAMDARTGEQLWAGSGRFAQGAAILSSGNVLLALTNEAKLVVFARDTDRYRQLAQYTVAEQPTWAHPILWDNNIVVKDEATLTLWRLE